MATNTEYEIELRIYSREDRKLVMTILADNGYDVGQHKRQRSESGKSVDYYVHAKLLESNAVTANQKG